jgi:hypothetical protein
MALDRLQFLKALEDSYSAYYNIKKSDSKTELPLIFEADFYKRDERYFMIKSANLYGNEMNEFVYVFSEESFSKELSDACIQYAMDDGLPRVKPHKEHQYTNIKVIFVADSFDEEAEKDIASRRFQKSYHFSLWGYSSLITAAVNVRSETVRTNVAGREMKKYFSKLFTAQHK